MLEDIPLAVHTHGTWVGFSDTKKESTVGSVNARTCNMKSVPSNIAVIICILKVMNGTQTTLYAYVWTALLPILDRSIYFVIHMFIHSFI